MKELSIVANKYSTDKGTERFFGNSPDESALYGSFCHHGYTEFYDYYFSKYKTSHPVILEIGVGEGGSTKMFNDYYNGNCEIYCLDINPDARVVEFIGNNIHFFECNQSDSDSLRGFADFLNINNIQFDIIIDDGNHVPDDMMLTFNYFYKYVKPEGLYILEDLHTIYDPRYNSDTNSKEHSPISFFTEFTDFHIFDKYTNDKLHNAVKSSILFTNKNLCRSENDDLLGMTMLILFES